MLPVYKAIAVDQAAIVGGSTKPCIMTVADSNGKIVGDYVVKVFKPNNIEQSQLDLLDEYASQLDSTGNDSSDLLEIKPYLESVKQNPDQFIQILQELIA
jgi:hypothetical protein